MYLRKLEISTLAETVLRLVLTLVAALTCIGGCTTIHIQTDGNVRTERTNGRVVVQVSDNATSTIVDTKGVGLVLGQRSGTLGRMREVIAWFDPTACHAVFFTANQEEAAFIHTQFKRANINLDHLCIFP
jgi:hypothetical protein